MGLPVLVMVATCALAGGPEGQAPDGVLDWIPQRPKQGEVVHLRAVLPGGGRVEAATLDDVPVHFFRAGPGTGVWHALVGLDAKAEEGPRRLSVRVAFPLKPGAEVLERNLEVLPNAYPEERLTLPPSKVSLSEKDLERVRREKAEISALWTQETPERLWRGGFQPPLEGRPGSPFGMRRWINDQPRSFHTGMDVKAPQGTPVRASNDGRVALVGDHFFGGRSVFLDHGQGLYTMYFHLSEILVHRGERVHKGDPVGKVGMTGRATGPHLHWGVRLGGARVDPMLLIERTRDLP